MAVYKDENKTKDGRCWYFKVYKKDFNGINKAFKSKRYLTKKEAQEEEALFIIKRDNPSIKPFILIANDWFKYMYKTRKESTVYCYEKIYKKNIYPYFYRYDITEISITLIKKWKDEMENKNFALNYLNKLYEILKNILDYAISNYGLENNPVEKVGRFQKVSEKIISDEEKLRYITFEEFTTFITVIDDIIWKTFFIFLYYTGMRKGEVQALTWKDIDFTNNEIMVNKTLSVKTQFKYKITNTKNYINRKIKMSRVLIDQLKEYKQEMMKYNDFQESWFVFGCSRFMPQTTIDRKKHEYFEKSGVREITIHEFRHSHVSLLINEYNKSGQTDTTKFFLMMSNRLGHSIPVMQKTYLHLFPSIQNEIINILDNL